MSKMEREGGRGVVATTFGRYPKEICFFNVFPKSLPPESLKFPHAKTVKATKLNVLQNNCPISRVQTEQQKVTLPGGHRLLSEYFQSCDRKQISCPGSVLLQETNLPSRFSGQARDEYYVNPPNIMVIRRMTW